MSVSKPLPIYILSILTIVCVVISFSVFSIGTYKTTKYSNEQALPQTASFTFSLSSTEFKISNVVANKDNNAFVIIARSNDTKNFGYAKGFDLYMKAASSLSDANANIYVYPNGVMFISVSSVDIDLLNQLGLMMTLRANRSIAKQTKTVNPTTYDTFDQADIVINTSAIKTFEDDITPETLYLKYVYESDSSITKAATTQLTKLSSDLAKYVEYSDQLSQLDIALTNPPEFCNVVVNETSIDTDYIMDGGVNFDYNDVESYLSTNNITTPQQLSDYISSLSSSSSNNAFNKSSLVYAKKSNGIVINDVDSLSNQYERSRINSVTQQIINIYNDLRSYECNALPSILSAYLDSWMVKTQYSATKDVPVILY